MTQYSATMGSNETSQQYGLIRPPYQTGGRRKKRSRFIRRRKSRAKSRKQRGGYNQYASNLATRTSYSTADNMLSYKNSMLANPTPFHRI